jgi:putative transposase
MQENRIIERHRKKRCRTTDSKHKLPVAANLLQQNFVCESSNRIWLADISCIATDAGFLYLAAMKDLCTKKIVGWSMNATIDAQLAVDALVMAYTRQKSSAGGSDILPAFGPPTSSIEPPWSG